MSESPEFAARRMFPFFAKDCTHRRIVNGNDARCIYSGVRDELKYMPKCDEYDDCPMLDVDVFITQDDRR